MVFPDCPSNGWAPSPVHHDRYNNGRFYVLVDGPKAVEPWKISKNQHVYSIHVLSAASFAENVPARMFPGDSVMLDFPYFLHPTAIGHWPEVLFPVYSMLRADPGYDPARVLLLSLKRAHLMPWARTIMALALGRRRHEDLPSMLWQRETDSVWHQILSNLEGLEETEWACFERVLLPTEMDLAGGSRTFLNKNDAHEFRRLVYQQFDLGPLTPVSASRPRRITFHRKTSNRRVINEPELVAMLKEFGTVEVVEHGNGTPMQEQLDSVARTDILVSVHTSALAVAPFLRPGAVVLELLQRNWRYQHLDESFKVQTETMGDIHHFAWRATLQNQTRYLNPRDNDRFGNWTTEMCNTEECVEAHTTVDVVVDVEAVRKLLEGRLAAIRAGATVAEAQLPWPPR